MNNALIVIDVQESFRQREAWARIDIPDIGDRIARLVDHARGWGRSDLGTALEPRATRSILGSDM